ncbi:MAG: NRDE family protein [Gammaproteobacteria bacterium]|nr:NRDE family protein [Gammaproteobacteria bacterium]
MCLIILAWQAHPDYPLIVAANRDEFYARPTRSAHFWPDHPQILAGRDLQAGGTWLGVNRAGHLAAVTNVRNPADNLPRPRSRGELPSEFLRGDGDIDRALQDIGARHDQYNGFNLLLANRTQLAYTSNRGTTASALDAGVYGLSNATLDTPWPKVRTAKNEMLDILTRDWQELSARQADLFQLLADERHAAAEELPDTGVGLEQERQLSPRFISSNEYGTRASTVVIVHRSGRLHFSEREFKRESLVGRQQHQLQLRD